MEYLLHILIIAGIYVILTMSLNLIVGYTGLAALGHAAFSCVGAYVSALLALNFGVSPWLGVFAAAIGATIVGLAISIPALRLRGDYLALATLGFAVIVYSIAKNWVDLTRGPLGLPSSVAAPLRQMIYGLLLTVLMLNRPQGIFGKYRF